MSRSRRKKPIASVAIKNGSERFDKQKTNRKLRNKIRQILRKTPVDADPIFPVVREVSNSYFFAKEAKLLFDVVLFPEGLRK